MRPNHMSSIRPRGWFTRLFAGTAEKESASPYHAVSIYCGKNACQAAQDKLGERTLSAEAPLLPLDICDRPDHCECRYRHFDDRRSGPRRRSEDGLQEQSDSEQEERRHATGRRADDFADEDETYSVHEDSYYEHMSDTVRTAILDDSEPEGIDPYNSGSFDKSKSWGSSSDD